MIGLKIKEKHDHTQNMGITLKTGKHGNKAINWGGGGGGGEDCKKQ